MPATIDSTNGPLDWSGTTEKDGHKTYTVTYLVRVERAEGQTGGLFEGPAAAMECPDLPQCGDAYEVLDSEGNVLDADPNAFAECTREARRHRSVKDTGPFEYFAVPITFTTKPQARCCDQPREDPLDEPQKVRIETENFTYEATQSIDEDFDEVVGFTPRPIRNSAWEAIHGPQNEWEDGRVKVTVEQNVADLELPLLTYLRNKVNDAPMWGLDARTIRFAGFTAEPAFAGAGCQGYWKRKLTFDVRFEGQDREVPDEGTMALNGHWGVNGGTGLTVTLVTSGGIITTAAITAGGSGYPRSATLTMTVPGGTGGLLGIPTNSSGVASGTVTVIDGGSGYSDGSSTPEGGNGWILDNVSDPCNAGEYHSPDPNNPADFSRYLDRNGNPAKVQFDCNRIGQPYDPCADTVEEETSWWAIVFEDAGNNYTREDTCSNAVFSAQANGGFVAGPFETEAEALAAEFDDGQDPDDVDCSGACLNTLTLRVYGEEDLFRLGVPVDIGDIGSF